MTEESRDTKACPFCAETIKAAAIVCKHCGRDLPKEVSPDESLMLRHGIVHKDERYVWRGNYFKQLDEAVKYVAKHAPNSIVAEVKLAPIDATPEKPFKWWLWVPLGAVALFFAYGASIPQYKADAMAARRLCEKSFRAPQYECDALYDKMLREGELKAMAGK